MSECDCGTLESGGVAVPAFHVATLTVRRLLDEMDAEDERLHAELAEARALVRDLRFAISAAWAARNMMEVNEALRPIIRDERFDRKWFAPTASE